MCVSRGDLTRRQHPTPDPRELHADWLPNSFYAELWGRGQADVWWPLPLRLAIASVLLVCCRSFAGSNSPTFCTPHPRRTVAGMAGADGRGVQDSDLGKGNELMKSHLGGKRGI